MASMAENKCIQFCGGETSIEDLGEIEDDIKMYLKETNWERVNCVYETRGRVQVAGCGEWNDPLGFIIRHKFLD